MHVLTHTAEDVHGVDIPTSVTVHAVRSDAEGCDLLKSLNPSVVHHHGAKTGWLFDAIDFKHAVGTEHGYGANIRPAFDWIIPVCGAAPNMIRHGVSLQIFRPRKGPRRRGPTRIGIVGRLTETKIHPDFIERLGIEPWHNAQFYFAGPKDEPGKVAERLAAMPHVRLAGDIPHYHMPTFFWDMDLVVCPSLTESVGLAAIEAMACGLPVLGLEADGLGDTIRGGGIVFNSVTELIDGLQGLLRKPELLPALGDGAREHAVACYDERRMFAEYHAVYHERSGGAIPAPEHKWQAH